MPKVGRKHDCQLKIWPPRKITNSQSRVLLKAVSTSAHPHEAAIGQLMTASPHSEDPRNHCISIQDIVQDPYDSDIHLLVMPICIPLDRPMFDTVGEVVDCIRQILEGIQYMHGNYIAHRDCNFTNVMQDPAVYPDGNFHPASPWMDSSYSHRSRPITRTECWPRYLIIDFGLSRRYDPSRGPPLEGIILGGDKSPPEHQKNLQCNPFPTDIYFLGNLLRSFVRPTWSPLLFSDVRAFDAPHRPLSFILPLIEKMMQQEPAQRPTIDEVVAEFEAVSRGLTKAHLRRPAQPLHSLVNLLRHRLRQAKRAWNGIPPLPPYTPYIPSSPLSGDMRDFFTKLPVAVGN
ncbi:kinase domain-containing protein [Favolaschia claudopus]|uniref:Kinase domain-containing protein n=1 Tax=Favolaschia claudopus TaxID=2862362 RepID=A0AAV9Z266_9AGAR